MYLNNLQSYTFASILLLFVAFISCERSSSLTNDKTYSGSFYTKNLAKDYAPTSFTLILEKGKYIFTPLENSPMKPSSGTYVLKDKLISFTDENMWTADFDWNLIFTGDFYISENNKEIILTKKRDDNFKYIYILEK
ncbi:hypothetical protein Pedsa_2110 [Pseudopedobacter saltans DSM 12145]|uniref:Lipocalin-like domain-containing protein n=1 Tax=Pseudopedobacter saltans (strain ATCC 51119 / DSM 12145 / JCM 21818 / CCUG 39354 / LMG 10337 / NBRC 100064 / NCIMB 13643) TaxID=762903 RepID=F0SB27_PSESL|nr:hypothetical protein [Pseudopedobacter saltans]ADY52662.1 hypothetical protein Pedsa_2110 [Pseudopedobacter saltans DSM 12145]